MNHSFSQMTKRSIRSLTAAYFIFLLILFAGSCSSYTPEEEALIAEIQQQRAEKDQDFKADPNSPLLAEDKTDFAGLKYYPIDLNLRFEGSIVRYDSLVPDTIIGTKGDLRPAVKYGYFPFEYRGEAYRLHLSSADWQHGFSLQPVNINISVHPGYEQIITLTPTETGEFGIVCNEFCGIGHHTMTGLIRVVE